jgi:hypothetical protein
MTAMIFAEFKMDPMEKTLDYRWKEKECVQ